MPLGMRDCSQPYSYPVGVARWLVFVGARKKSAVGRSTSIETHVIREMSIRDFFTNTYLSNRTNDDDRKAVERIERIGMLKHAIMGAFAW